MPEYAYRAIDTVGVLKKGRVVALGPDDVENRLRQRGFTLIKCSAVKAGMFDKFLVEGKIKPRIIIEFYYRLSQVLALGMPILTALDENAKQLPSKAMKKIVESIRVRIEAGNSLSDALSQFPKAFQKLDLGLIRMGEQAGVLPKCLKELAEFLEWKEDIRSTLKRATIYPIFIIIVLAAVIGVWVGYVLPQMAAMLADMGVALPAMTRIVLNGSIFLRKHWLLILSGLFFFVFFFVIFQKTRRGKILIHQYLLKLPVIGTVAGNIALARLSRNFATMYGSGMNIHDIFDVLTDNVLGNRYLEASLAAAFREIQGGQSISAGLEGTGSFPPFLTGAVRNGELTGTMDESFGRLGDYYDAEVKQTVQVMINAIEPITIILLGGVFGLIALSIMLPLYDVIGQVGQAY